jgi:hypothetical protein
MTRPNVRVKGWTLSGPSPAAPADSAVATSSPASKYQSIIDSLQRTAITAEDEKRQDKEGRLQRRETGPQLTAGPADQSDAHTRAFVRLTDLPNHPIDRLSRYEATLWRQASQILFALHCLERGTFSRLRVRLR